MLSDCFHSESVFILCAEFPLQLLHWLVSYALVEIVNEHHTNVELGDLTEYLRYLFDMDQAGAPASVLQSQIPLPSKLDLTGNIAQNCKSWKQIWDSYDKSSS